jgi:hypothetical protein
VTDSGIDGPWPASDGSTARGGTRLVVVIAIVLLLALLLIAASNPAQGCGGG